MFRRCLIASVCLAAVISFAPALQAGHHHRYQYYQAAPAYYAAPMVYAAPPAPAAPQSTLLELLLPILLERVRDGAVDRGGGTDRGGSGDGGAIREDLRRLQAELAEFRSQQSAYSQQQAGANEGTAISLQRQLQELATVRADLEAMKTKLDAVASSTSSNSTLQANVAEMRARFPQRSKADVRATLLDELNKKIKALAKLDAAEQQALIDALTKDFDAQLNAAFPNWKE